jgi:secreted trypsin-like serine protease
LTAGVYIAGTQLSGAGSMKIGVDLEFPNPQYKKPNPDDNDLMLVKLTSPSSAPVVHLNFDPLVPVNGQSLTVIGFGDKVNNGSFSQELLETEVPTVPFSKCNDHFGGLTQDIMICSGGSFRDSCQGDSGGPLLSSPTVQVGIVSFGDGCGQPGVPAVYT